MSDYDSPIAGGTTRYQVITSTLYNESKDKEPKDNEPKGKKFDQGKPRLSLIPASPLEEVAKVFTFGATKYDDHNWRRGLKYSRLLDAAERHILEVRRNRDIDPESNCLHLAHACCNLLMLLEFQLQGNKTLDDRYKE